MQQKLFYPIATVRIMSLSSRSPIMEDAGGFKRNGGWRRYTREEFCQKEQNLQGSSRQVPMGGAVFKKWRKSYRYFKSMKQ